MNFSIDSIRSDAQIVRDKYAERKSDAKKRMIDNIDLLKEDHNKILEETLSHIRPLAVNGYARGQQTIRIWDLPRVYNVSEKPLNLTIQPSTHWTGFWDKLTGTHDISLWEKANLKLMMDALNEHLAPLRLENVSDATRSRRSVYVCHIPV